MISAHSRGQQTEAHRRSLMTSVSETQRATAQTDQHTTSKYRERDLKVVLWNSSRGILILQVDWSAQRQVKSHTNNTLSIAGQFNLYVVCLLYFQLNALIKHYTVFEETAKIKGFCSVMRKPTILF